MCQRHAAAVFQRIEGFGVLVEFQQVDVGMIFGEIGISGGAFVHQQGFTFQLGKVGNRRAFGGNHAQGHVHIGAGEIHHFGAFGRLGEVGED